MAPTTTMDDSARTHANDGPRGAAGAGALLRAAREQQGMHIATLAAAIKVAPRKLEALEDDRWDELPGPTFTRALAQAVCRALKTDPQAVMELLPPADTSMLDSTFGTINEPFAGAGREPGLLGWLPRGPWLIAAIALVLAAALVVWMPAGTWSRLLSAGRTAPTTTIGVGETTAPIDRAPAAATPPALTAAATGTGPATTAAPAATTPPQLPAAPPTAGTAPGTAASPGPAAAAAVPAPSATGAANVAGAVPAGALVVACAARTWIEVVDARGRVLVSRNLEAGESLGLDGLTPLQVVVGNAAATQVTYKGAPVEILSRARDNVARFELK